MRKAKCHCCGEVFFDTYGNETHCQICDREFSYWVREFDKVMERMAMAEKHENVDEDYKQMLEVQFQYCRKMVIKYKGEQK